MPEKHQQPKENDYPYPKRNRKAEIYAQLFGVFVFGLIAVTGFCSFIADKGVYWQVWIGSSITWFVLIAMFFQAHITHKQWKAMRKALKQTERAIKISKKQAKIAAQAVIETQITRVIENSPFIAPSGAKLATPSLMPDVHDQRITVKITNTGKSPALNVKFRRQFAIGDVPIGEFYPFYDERPPKESAFIAPGGEILVSYRLPLFILDELERIDDGIEFIYIWGLFEYKDIFGRDHWTEYAMRYRAGTAAFDTCPNGNSCDYEYQANPEQNTND